MTDRTKSRLRNASLWAIAATAIITWVAPASIEAGILAVDQRYVKQDSFAAFKQGLVYRRGIDSVTHAGEYQEIRRLLMGLDSASRCQRGRPEFCR